MEPSEYNFIKYKVRRLLQVDLNAYRSAQMQRRLRTYLLRSGHESWPRFFRAIQDDPEALARLRDYLTINVTAFFRDAEKFDDLRTTILPQLLQARRRLRVWSAGCSAGQEAYTLAIILAEATGPYTRHTLLATDIDGAALARARAGGPYPEDKMDAVPPDLLRRYFRPCEGGYRVTDSLRRKVTFARHNLLSDAFETDLDLIVCRNVVIYFSAEVKARLYEQFRAALRPGGVLFVGSTEVLPRAARWGLTSMGGSFYRRTA